MIKDEGYFNSNVLIIVYYKFIKKNTYQLKKYKITKIGIICDKIE